MEIEFEEETNESSLLYFVKKHKVKLIIISVILLFTTFICYGCYKTICPTDWHYFNSKRIEFIENKYQISLDNAKPKNYKVVSIAQDHDADFYFEVDDYKKFMENDFHGKAIMNSFENPDGSAEYRCRLDEKYCCNIYFTKKNGKYEGLINRYYWSESNEVSTQPSTEGYMTYSVG